MNKSIRAISYVAVLAPITCTTTNRVAQPNVIIIYTDDQGYQDLGCFDSPKIKTPNIDKMAEEILLNYYQKL
ncbi:MAG: sulfatase-like hydrolase/transferase [Rikenellaceae bacterium]